MNTHRSVASPRDSYSLLHFNLSAPRATTLVRTGIGLLAGLLLAPGAAGAPASPAGLPAPLFEQLGRHHHPVTTRSAEAQRYFDQGLLLLFNFNHQEAIRSFRAAAQLDPDCVMAYWGEAFAYGPHVNAPMFDEAVAPAWAALQAGLARRAVASPRERDYLDALASLAEEDSARRGVGMPRDVRQCLLDDAVGGGLGVVR